MAAWLNHVLSVLHQPGVDWILSLVLLGLFIAPVAIAIWARTGASARLTQEVIRRYMSWLVIVPLIVGPVLLGRYATIAGVLVLSVLCYREYARATGLFRDLAMSLLVVVGIVLVELAAAAHWYRGFAAMVPIVILLIVGIAVTRDQPKGYIQRVALALIGFLFFGVCLGHLGYLANDEHFASLILMLLLAVECNDIFAFLVGKTLGGPKLVPNTSPNKTVSGSVGALVLTTLLVYIVSGLVFTEGPLAWPLTRVVLGILLSVAGQMGDLVVSSIKRDVGIKDTGNMIPGHGGVLDRANSLLLTAPALFHYVNHFHAIGPADAARLFGLGG